MASTLYRPENRCSVDIDPGPKSTRSRNPSASTRYAEQGASGPGKLPAQPRTVSLMLPPTTTPRRRLPSLWSRRRASVDHAGQVRIVRDPEAPDDGTRTATGRGRTPPAGVARPVAADGQVRHEAQPTPDWQARLNDRTADVANVTG